MRSRGIIWTQKPTTTPQEAERIHARPDTEAERKLAWTLICAFKAIERLEQDREDQERRLWWRASA